LSFVAVLVSAAGSVAILHPFRASCAADKTVNGSLNPRKKLPLYYKCNTGPFKTPSERQLRFTFLNHFLQQFAHREHATADGMRIDGLGTDQ
jgi:hypothetical protein